MSTAKEYKEKANAYLKNKEYELALECYNKCIELAAKDHVHWSNRSACYINLGKYTEALDDAKMCISINANWARGYQRKGMAESKLEQFDNAIASYKKGLEIDPNSQACKDGLAEVEQINSNPFMKNMGKLWTNPKTAKYMQDPNFVNTLNFAIKDQKMLMQLMQTDPRFMDVFTVLTGIDLANMQENAQKQQKESAEEKIKREKEEAEAKKKKEEEEKIKAEEERLNAMSEEDRKAELVKKEAEAIKQQGNVKYKAKEFKEALELYLKASSMNPEEATFYLNISACYHELKDFENVVKYCNKVLDNTYDFQKKSKALGRIAFAYQDQGDYIKAVEFFQKSLLEYKDPRITQALRAAETLKKKQEDEAYINPAKGEEANTKGNELYKKGDYTNCIKEYTEAIKRDPTLAKYYTNRAAAYIKVMSFGEALRDCDKCLELDPNSLRGHQRKSNCHMFLKQYHKALSAYEAGLKLFPQDAELKEGHTKCYMKINEGGDDEERLRQTMQDPEIQGLMVDPRVQQLLKDLRENPNAASMAIQRDEFLGGAFRKLVAAGIIKTK